MIKNTFKIRVLNEPYFKKPRHTTSGTNEYTSISYNFKSGQAPTININNVNDVVEAIKTFGVIEPYKKGSTTSSLIFLDFDKTHSVHDVLKVADKYNLVPTIVYKTVSEKFTGRSLKKIFRFRFVYVLNEPLQIAEYKQIVSMFHNIFKGSIDKVTKNVDRWYFTGKRDTNCILQTNRSFSLYDIKVNIKMFDHIMLQTPTTKSATHVVKKVKDSVALGLVNKCKLYKRHTQQHQLSHEEKMMLTTNLSHIDNGKDLFLNYLIDGVNTKSRAKWENHLDFISVSKYRPMACKHCSHYSSCATGKKHGTIFYSMTNSNTSNGWDNTKISLSEARNRLDDYFTDDMKSKKKNMVYVYKVQAGVGKTEILINNFGNGVYAFPSHTLKREKVGDIQSKGYAPFVTPNVYDIVTKESDVKLVTKCYNTGNSFLIRQIVKKYDKGNEYLRRSNMPLRNGTVTTHHKLNRCEFAKDVKNIFYDEDPTTGGLFIYKRINHKYVLNDFKTLKKLNVITQAELNSIKKFLVTISKYEIPTKTRKSKVRIKMIKKIVDYQKQNNSKLRNNLVGFLEADLHTKQSYSKLNLLPQNKNVFIFSATPDIKLIKRIAELSGKTVEVRTIENVERIGKIKQYLINTTRAGFKRNKRRLIDEIARNGNKTITFKSASHIFNRFEDMPYGGNTLGYNYLSGEDINVAYTFQLLPEYYFHKYTLLYDKQITDVGMARRRVSRADHEFVYYSYNDTKLRELVFDDIDSEMIQAVERNRTISTNSTATILSEFLCSIVNFEDVKEI